MPEKLYKLQWGDFLKIVFMGTPDFAVPCLNKLIEMGHEILLVVTQPDRPRSRGMKLTPCPVKECALNNNINVVSPEKIKNDDEFYELYKSLEPDLAVVVAFGQILPKRILDVPKYGSINVHGSLLPKYRGAAPIQWAVINGEKTTGITTMFMDVGMDTGDIILKEEVEIGEEETAGELFDRLSLLGAEVLEKTINLFETNNVPREKQPDNATYAPMLTKELGNIDFTKTSEEIVSLIKGLNPWPVAYTMLNGLKLKVYSAKIREYTGEAGTIIKSDHKEGLIVATKNSSVELIEIQPENKKRMTAKAYLVGNKI